MMHITFTLFNFVFKTEKYVFVPSENKLSIYCELAKHDKNTFGRVRAK